MHELKPERDSSLVEVLDKLLNKGVVLNADLIISVAGVPMIGVNLRAALASIETMLDYGIMEAWDKSTREWYARQERKDPLEYGEDIFFKAFGYIWQSKGLISTWVPGLWYVTNRRLLLWRREPAEIVFEAPLQIIDALVEMEGDVHSIERTELELRYGGETARICIAESDEFIRSLGEATKHLGKHELASTI